jgi:hypothetical protein
MALKLYPEENIQSIASAIRTKNGLSTSYTTSQMAQAIIDIPSGDTDAYVLHDYMTSLSSIPESKKIDLSYSTSDGVLAFNNFAFAFNQNIRTIAAPDCSTLFGDGLFFGAMNLTSVSFPELISVTLSVDRTREGAYHSEISTVCIPQAGIGTTWNLPSISFSQSHTSWGTAMFARCTSLADVYMPKLTNIAQGMFLGCSNLTNVDIESAITIGSRAFNSCYKLPSITLPNVTTIYAGAFAECMSLSYISAPNLSLISGVGAFTYCSSITRIEFPNLKKISGPCAFYNMSGLSYISLPELTECIGTSLGFYPKYGGSTFTFCYLPKLEKIQGATGMFHGTSLSSIYMPKVNYISNVTSLFDSCPMINIISFPFLSESINSQTFAYASSRKHDFTEVFLPALKNVSAYTFQSFWNLTTVVFSDVSSIGGYAFSSCFNLMSLYILGSSVATLNANAVFRSTPISNYTTSTGGVYGSIFVPQSLFDAYKSSTNWVVYSSRFASLTDAQISAILNS